MSGMAIPIDEFMSATKAAEQTGRRLERAAIVRLVRQELKGYRSILATTKVPQEAIEATRAVYVCSELIRMIGERK